MCIIFVKFKPRMNRGIFVRQAICVFHIDFELESFTSLCDVFDYIDSWHSFCL